MIDRIFQISDWCSIYNGTWPKTKKEIKDNIISQYTDDFDTKKIKEAYEIRKKWNKITDVKLESYFPIGIQYIQEVVEYMIKKNKKNENK